MNLPRRASKRTRIASLRKRSFASFCYGKPHEDLASPHQPGKNPAKSHPRLREPAAIQRRQQRTLSRDPGTRRQLRKPRRSRRPWAVHADLISVASRRAPRLNKWRRHPPPPARHPSSLSAMSRQRSKCFRVSYASRWTRVGGCRSRPRDHRRCAFRVRRVWFRRVLFLSGSSNSR
jgi:hypothetical protein